MAATLLDADSPVCIGLVCAARLPLLDFTEGLKKKLKNSDSYHIGEGGSARVNY